MNHGLLFSGPLPPRSWVREPQKCRNPIGYGPSSGLNIAGVVGRASVAMDHACCQLIAKKLHAGQYHRHICRELGICRSLVFKIKKLQDDGQDLTPQPLGGSKRTVRTVAAIARVRRAVATNPQRSIRQLARLHKMDSRTMRHLVKEDLGLESHVIVQRPLLTTDWVSKKQGRRGARS
jgi:hypothetical protein